jgi:arylsulfatase A-like enzyme
VGKVIEGFEKAGLADDTIFIVTGDHGEAFREHGRRLHSDVPWVEGLQVPLLIKAPGRWQDGEKLDRTVQNLAMLPTVVDLLGFEIDGGKYHAPSILDAPRDPGAQMSHCWNVEQCAVYFPDERHAYLYFYDNQAPEYYDLAQDPFQKNDLIDSVPEERRESYEKELVAWVAETEAVHDLSRRLAARD